MNRDNNSYNANQRDKIIHTSIYSQDTINDTINNNNFIYNYKNKPKPFYEDKYGRPDLKLINWAYNNASSPYDNDDVRRIIEYFFVNYNKHKKKKHPTITPNKFIEIINDLHYCWNPYGEFINIEFLEYKTMIEYYFNHPQAFRGNAQGFDPLIFHFMKVREECHWAACRNYNTAIKGGKNDEVNYVRTPRK